jgi:ATP-dependent Lon protease
MSAPRQTTEGAALPTTPVTATETQAPDADTRPQAAALRPIPQDALIILPVRNVVIFPGTIFPIVIGRPRSQVAVQEAIRLEQPLGVLLQSKADADDPGPDDVH